LEDFPYIPSHPSVITLGSKAFDKGAVMAQPSFYQWLQSQGDRDDIVGDFAKDVVQDADFPKDAALDAMIGYLRTSFAPKLVIGALETAYAAYLKKTGS
jgi:uncharacterized protein YozE (UPF0346 family)